MYKTKLMPTRVCICDRCGRVIAPNDHDEDQERLAIDFIAGYGSVFGDGNRVQADLCQHCVHKVLGRWLRITAPPEDERGRVQPHPEPENPRRAGQPYQWRQRSRGESLLSRLFRESLGEAGLGADGVRGQRAGEVRHG